MARWPRLWEKKRGKRRTGSPIFGSVGEAMFFASLLFLGSIGLVAVVASIAFESVVATFLFPEATYVAGECVVMESELGEKTLDDGAVRYQPQILVHVRTDDQDYYGWTYRRNPTWFSDREAAKKIVDGFRPGWVYPCWYASHDPSTVILRRSTNFALWCILLVFTSFATIGTIGMFYTLLLFGASAERRSALAKSAQKIELIGDLLPPSAYPNIPSADNLTNSPGVRLAYRLPIEVSPAWWLFATLLFSLIWCGMTAVFALGALADLERGEPNWLLMVITVAAVGVGVWSIYHFLRQIALHTRVGPTYIEISNHPLLPGRDYKLHLSQAGRMHVKKLRVTLVCEEEATFLHGTDVRTETAKVYDAEVANFRGLVIRPGAPFEELLHFQIPAAAMHSFKSSHNAVHWKLIVDLDAKGAGHQKRSFPIVVYPPVKLNS